MGKKIKKIGKKISKPFKKAAGKIIGGVAGAVGGGMPSGPSGPSAAEIAKMDLEQAKNYWGEYSQWKQTEQQRLQQDMAGYAAKYGSNPEMLKVFADKRAKEYEAEIQSLDSGERGKFLKDYFAKQGGTGSMDEWYTKKFGGPTAAAPEEKKKATGKPKQKIQMGPSMREDIGSGFFDDNKTGTGWW
jgi:hypothetical protein